VQRDDNDICFVVWILRNGESLSLLLGILLRLPLLGLLGLLPLLFVILDFVLLKLCVEDLLLLKLVPPVLLHT